MFLNFQNYNLIYLKDSIKNIKIFGFVCWILTSVTLKGSIISEFHISIIQTKFKNHLNFINNK